MDYIIPFATLLTIAILLLTIFLGYGRRWRWTGLTGYYGDDGVYRTRNKTLWDWVDLVIIGCFISSRQVSGPSIRKNKDVRGKENSVQQWS